MTVLLMPQETRRERHNRLHREAQRKRRALNPEYHRRLNREHRERDPEQVRRQQREASRRFKERHPERVKASCLRSYRQRLKQDPGYRVLMNLRSRLNGAVTEKGSTKLSVKRQLLGCGSEELRAHLEKRFLPGMSWENYGSGWHVDHIKPCAKFDLTDPDQQKVCFHYMNLQPLWADENRRKGAA